MIILLRDFYQLCRILNPSELSVHLGGLGTVEPLHLQILLS